MEYPIRTRKDAKMIPAIGSRLRGEIIILLVVIFFLLLCFARSISQHPQAIYIQTLLFVALSATMYHILHLPCRLPDPRREAFTLQTADPLTRDLKIYLSAMEKDSYTGSGQQWKNTAPSATNDTLFTFSGNPRFDEFNGLSIDSLSIKGPKSQYTGINTTKPFTVAWFARTNSLPLEKEVPILTLHAANETKVPTVAFRASLLKASETDISLIVQYGQEEPIIYKNTRVSDMYLLHDRAYHLFVVSRDEAAINIYIDKMTADGAVRSAPLKQKVFPVLSNLEMTIASAGNWNADLLAVALYARGFTPSDVDALWNHYNSMRLAQSQQVKALQNSVASLNESIAKTKKSAEACPYEAVASEVCKKECSEVKWSQGIAALNTASESCRVELVKACNKNETAQKDPACSIFRRPHMTLIGANTTDPEAEAKKTAELKTLPPFNPAAIATDATKPAATTALAPSAAPPTSEAERILQEYREENRRKAMEILEQKPATSLWETIKGLFSRQTEGEVPTA